MISSRYTIRKPVITCGPLVSQNQIQIAAFENAVGLLNDMRQK